jgi:hypothetical protein
MDPDTLATDDDTRDGDGRFRPGTSGNPRGRPPGSSRALAWPGRWPRPAWSRW